MGAKYLDTCSTLVGNRPSVVVRNRTHYVDHASNASGALMPEPIDIIVPILQKIQADIADVKRDLGGKIDGLGARMDGLTGRMDGLTDRMDAFEAYFTHTMGLTQQNIADIKRIRADIAAINIRLNGPEAPRP
jgi:hypothetical protein